MTDAAPDAPLYHATLDRLAEEGARAALEMLRREKGGPGGDAAGTADQMAATALLARETLAHEEAAAWAGRAVEFAPDFAPALAELGAARRALGDEERARRALDLATGRPGLGPDGRAELHLWLAELALDAGEPEAARAALRRIGAPGPSPGIAADAAALAAHAAVLTDPASVAALPGDYALSAGERLRKLIGTGRRGSAALLVRRLLRVAPDDADAIAAAAHWKASRGEYEEALRLVGDAIFRTPRDELGARVLRARLHYRLGRFREAAAELSARGVADALTPELVSVLADCQRRLGDTDEARRLANLVLAQAPDEPGAQVLMWRLDCAGPGAVHHEEQLEKALSAAASGAELFLIAERSRATAPELARRAAAAAIARAPALPEAGEWQDEAGAGAAPAGAPLSALEGAGFYAPHEDEGRAWPSESERALLALLLGPEEDLRAAWTGWAGRHDIDRLSLGCYRLLPIAHARLGGAVAGLPHGGVIAALWRRACVESVANWRRGLPALDAMAEAGIPVMLMKGAAFAERHYGGWGARPMSDIDFLVPEGRAAEADALLRERGWVPSPGFNAIRLRLQYALTYRKPGGGNLDMHWRPMAEMCLPGHDERALWELSEGVELFGRPFRVPDPSFALFHTIVHGLRWNHISPVRWMADARMLLEAEAGRVDGARLWDLAARFRSVLPLGRGLELLAETFPVLAGRIAALGAPPGEIHPAEPALMRQRLAEPTAAVPAEDMRWLVADFRDRMQGLERAGIVVAGGAEPEAVAAWCRAAGVPWIETADRKAARAIRDRLGLAGVVLIDGALNGQWQALFRASASAGAARESGGATPAGDRHPDPAAPSPR
jgi:tetratricopeptide (TPR) repeat protein